MQKIREWGFPIALIVIWMLAAAYTVSLTRAARGRARVQRRPGEQGGDAGRVPGPGLLDAPAAARRAADPAALSERGGSGGGGLGVAAGGTWGLAAPRRVV